MCGWGGGASLKFGKQMPETFNLSSRLLGGQSFKFRNKNEEHCAVELGWELADIRTKRLEDRFSWCC